jgi:hypothetical protein
MADIGTVQREGMFPSLFRYGRGFTRIDPVKIGHHVTVQGFPHDGALAITCAHPGITAPISDSADTGVIQ